MTGALVAGLVGLEWSMTHVDTLTLIVVGMSACLGAVVGAPVTGILIVFEMTHQFALVPVLMIGALVSQAISRKMNRQNFYDALLTQDGHQLEHVRPPAICPAGSNCPSRPSPASSPSSSTASTPPKSRRC